MGVPETGKTYEKLAEKVIAHLEMLISRSGLSKQRVEGTDPMQSLLDAVATDQNTLNIRK